MAKKLQSSSGSGRVHIISRSSGWAVKKEGASRAGKVYGSKSAAVNGAKSATTKGHDIIVHKRDGSIQKWEKVK